MGQVGSYRLTDNRGFGLTPRRACPQAVTFQAEEGPERQTDVIPLGMGGAVLGAFDATVLLDTAMVRFDAPSRASVFRPLVSTHRQVARGPVVAATVWGDHRDHRDEAIALQMHDRAFSWNRYVPDRSVARPIRINQAIGLQVGQPLPVQ